MSFRIQTTNNTADKQKGFSQNRFLSRMTELRSCRQRESICGRLPFERAILTSTPTHFIQSEKYHFERKSCQISFFLSRFRNFRNIRMIQNSSGNQILTT